MYLPFQDNTYTYLGRDSTLPYDIRKRNCEQADGKKGKYVVVKKKSKGRTEQESCHASEKKAKGAVRARYANEANEGETVKITLEELRQLISEAMAEVTRPLPVYEEDAEILSTYEEGEEEDEESLGEISDEARGEIEAIVQQDAEETLAKLETENTRSAAALTEAVMVALRPMTKPVHQELTRDEFWMKVAGIKAESLNEGEVVDMFSGGQTRQNAVERIARALAARAEEMLDADGDGDDIAVHVDHKLFLSPFTDIDGHGGEVQALAASVYENYVSGKAGDQAESLDSIIERISIDYFDEDIEYILGALGDDRFDGTQDQMMRTKEMASQQSADELADMDMDFEKYMQGIESGKITPLERDED